MVNHIVLTLWGGCGKGASMSIKKMRQKRGLTQKQLADRLGVKQSNISRWESGAFKPNAATLKKMAAVLNCRIDDLI